MAKERNVNTTIELCAGDDRPIKVHFEGTILIARCVTLKNSKFN